MADIKDYQPWHRYRDAMSAAARLSLEDGDEALRLLDDAIALAISEHENQWALTLSHPAVVSNSLRDLSRVKRYYQQSLAFNPENPSALYGLADVANKEGELELAKEYAARCYKTLTEGDDFLKDTWLETLLKKWPELAAH
jgi:hypothetical protein